MAKPSRCPPRTLLYGVAYRPIVREGQEQIEIWPSPLEIGQPLPVLPLALNAELALADRPGGDLHGRLPAPPAELNENSKKALICRGTRFQSCL